MFIIKGAKITELNQKGKYYHYMFVFSTVL